VRLRLLRKSEIPQAGAIARKNYSGVWERAAIREIADMFSDSTMRPYFYAAEEGGEVIGFAGFAQSWMNYNIYDIFWVNVAPEHKGKGVGKALVGKIIKIISETRGSKLIQLTATPENAVFYEKHFGFKSAMRLRRSHLMQLKF
jgi:ribosomal protein S18 acetylase RimI-like enzyme